MYQDATSFYRDTSFTHESRSRDRYPEPPPKQRAPAETVAEQTITAPPAPPPAEQPKQQTQAVVQPANIWMQGKQFAVARFVEEHGQSVMQFQTSAGDWTKRFKDAAHYYSEHQCAVKGHLVAEIDTAIHEGIHPRQRGIATDYVARAYPINSSGSTVGKKTTAYEQANVREAPALPRYIVDRNGNEAFMFTDTRRPEDAFSYSNRQIAGRPSKTIHDRCKKDDRGRNDAGITLFMGHREKGISGAELEAGTRTVSVGAIFTPIRYQEKVVDGATQMVPVRYAKSETAAEEKPAAVTFGRSNPHANPRVHQVSMPQVK